MEREMNQPLRSVPHHGPPPGASNLDQIRATVSSIRDAAEKIMSGLDPVEAEDYLEMSRQRGAQ